MVSFYISVALLDYYVVLYLTFLILYVGDLKRNAHVGNTA